MISIKQRIDELLHLNLWNNGNGTRVCSYFLQILESLIYLNIFLKSMILTKLLWQLQKFFCIFLIIKILVMLLWKKCLLFHFFRNYIIASSGNVSSFYHWSRKASFIVKENHLAKIWWSLETHLSEIYNLQYQFILLSWNFRFCCQQTISYDRAFTLSVVLNDGYL